MSQPTIRRPSPSSTTPLYLQLEALIAERITSGEWAAGEQIPPESELCELYGVSRVTVRQALARLVRRGMLTRGRGKGTFVRDAQLTAGARSVSSFTAELSDLGMRAGSRLLGLEEAAADEETAAALERDPGVPVYRIRRLRTGDDHPIAIQTTYLVAELFPGLPTLLGDDISLYALFRERFGVVPLEAAEVFRVAGVPREFAAVLEVPRGSHAFHVSRITYDGRQAFEYTVSVIRGDRYQIRLALRNP